jgi:hypothetical protein
MADKVEEEVPVWDTRRREDPTYNFLYNTGRREDATYNFLYNTGRREDATYNLHNLPSSGQLTNKQQGLCSVQYTPTLVFKI